MCSGFSSRHWQLCKLAIMQLQHLAALLHGLLLELCWLIMLLPDLLHAAAAAAAAAAACT
jgi:hypothetical protein